MKLLKSFFKEEEGLGTVEIVLILVVLVSIAIMFRKVVIQFVQNTLGEVKGQLNDENVSGVTDGGL